MQTEVYIVSEDSMNCRVKLIINCEDQDKKNLQWFLVFNKAGATKFPRTSLNFSSTGYDTTKKAENMRGIVWIKTCW